MFILVDTSVWIAHLRYGEPKLQMLLNEANVVCHPFIIGELACGDLRNRATILSLLNSLPQTELAEHDEVLSFIESKHLMATGMGYVDCHLLASAMLSHLPIWTFDRKFAASAGRLGISFSGNIQ